MICILVARYRLTIVMTTGFNFGAAVASTTSSGTLFGNKLSFGAPATNPGVTSAGNVWEMS